MDKHLLYNSILELKEKRRAIILAHNYQREEIQEIADYTGDSLELSRIAANAQCEVIVFCGVNFMAESASILSPNKTVLLPAQDASCPMADMITIDEPRDTPLSYPGYNDPPALTYPVNFTLRDIKNRYPNVPVVAYVNTTANVKAESDICCTSANVVKVINSLPNERVICLPDKNLSDWAQKNTKKQIISWDGYCHVHDRVRLSDIESAHTKYPNAIIMAHPECRIEILEHADYVTSTSGMLRYAKESNHNEFVVVTENGILYKLKKENPNKTFYPLRKDMICPNMKKTTLPLLYEALKDMKHIVKVPHSIQIPAKKALDRMLEIK
ncbi:MAG: quinolinate synthase [Candidatus Magnetoovum sp. WYHC-5]|nr:quinolinate synthase [Candidatus Magnetoovum sp. WYHC-5]